MDRITATKTIAAEWQRFYPADKKGKGIICPLCGNGKHENRDGDGKGVVPNKAHDVRKAYCLHCFKCGFTGNIIDLRMRDLGRDVNSKEQFRQTVDEMAEEIGIVIDDVATAENVERSFADLVKRTGQDKFADPDQKNQEPDQQEQSENPSLIGQEPNQQETDYREYFLTCRERLRTDPDGQAYLAKRGISLETALAWGVGYDPAWVSPTVIRKQQAKGSSWTPPATPRLIIPSTAQHYVARYAGPGDGGNTKKMNEGSAEIFGLSKVLTEKKDPVFVVEGAIDALSIIEAGQAAVGLNSTSNWQMLVERLKDNPTATTFVLCLDNDEAGHNATEELKKAFGQYGIQYVVGDICNGHKDPNDALCADHDAFVASVRLLATQRPNSVSLYIDTLLADDIERRKALGKRDTGFKNLNKATGGGLRPGLYFLGAISSLGKTTFCSQMADNMAAAGNDVIYFSMEQSRLDMVTKSLARETWYLADAAGDRSKAVQGDQIMDGYKSPLLAQAAESYKQKIGDRLSIVEAGFECTTQYITDYVRKYFAKTGKRPVIFVDYLQILKPGTMPNGRKQDIRETVEEAIRALVLLKRELDLTIISIVSLNRSNYMTPFDFESIKETGLAEYSADAIWGLELTVIDDEIFDQEKNLKEKRKLIKKAKKACPRKIRLSSLKHRQQQGVYQCCFEYYPQYDLFLPDFEADERAKWKEEHEDEEGSKSTKKRKGF